MMTMEAENLPPLSERGCVLREDGKEYVLRVIEGSGGQLELVEIEQQKKLHWFFEWARIMQLTGWGM